jgi:hypothetical protein
MCQPENCGEVPGLTRRQWQQWVTRYGQLKESFAIE